jgi:hypothetical protein
VGVGERGRRVEEAGARVGGSLPTGGRCTADSGPRLVGAGDMCGVHAANRTEGEGEADRGVAATVSGGGTSRQAGPGWQREREGAERGAVHPWAGP